MITRKGYLKDYTFIDEDTGQIIKIPVPRWINVRCYAQFNSSGSIHRTIILETYPYFNEIGCTT